jgi:hypothetical protein
MQEAKLAIDWSAVDFSKSPSRPMKRQHVWSVRVCAKLSAPLLVALVFFGAMYMIGSASTSKIKTTATTASVIEERKARVLRPARDVAVLTNHHAPCPSLGSSTCAVAR